MNKLNLKKREITYPWAHNWVVADRSETTSCQQNTAESPALPSTAVPSAQISQHTNTLELADSTSYFNGTINVTQKALCYQIFAVTEPKPGSLVLYESYKGDILHFLRNNMKSHQHSSSSRVCFYYNHTAASSSKLCFLSENFTALHELPHVGLSSQLLCQLQDTALWGELPALKTDFGHSVAQRFPVTLHPKIVLSCLRNLDAILKLQREKH